MPYARIVFAFSLLFSLLPLPASAQLSLAELQAKLTGSWLATVEGEARQRILEISAVVQRAEGQFTFSGNYNFVDAKPGPGAAVKDTEIQQSSQQLLLVFRSGSDSLITANAKPDGSIEGSIRYKNGQVKAIRFVKGAKAEAAPVVTAFDGNWKGGARPFGANCVRGDYEFDVQDGKISGTVTYHLTSAPPCTSTVSGTVNPDNSATLTLRRNVPGCRVSRFEGKFDKNQFKATDDNKGICVYDVYLEKRS